MCMHGVHDKGSQRGDGKIFKIKTQKKIFDLVSTLNHRLCRKYSFFRSSANDAVAIDAPTIIAIIICALLLPSSLSLNWQ